MGVRLGTRIAGLCLAGTVAVVAASCAGDAGGPPPEVALPGVSRGAADGGPAGAPRPTVAAPRSVPSWRADGGSGPVAAPEPSAPVRAPASSPRLAPAVPSPAATSVADDSPRSPAVPDWLPPGPDSPDTDAVPDPGSVYDRLRAPDRCGEVRDALADTPPTGDWRVLRGLAEGCLAVQGRGGDWAAAAREHAALAGRLDTCKGRAAYAVLDGLLRFHRRHPGATVRPAAPSGGAAACAYGVTGADAGEDGTVRPGEVVRVHLRDAYFDPAELLRDGSVSVGGVPVPGRPVAAGGSGDRLTLSVLVPPLPADPATPVDVRVRLGAVEAVLEGAFRVVGDGAGGGGGGGGGGGSPQSAPGAP
ncbi:hypothetical protein [Streptomyces fumanus]|uniref:hypothetical protein n=1 Tax=Streptomyces fumanus TaxID=67302 RepID=UPI0033C91AA3